MKNSQQFVTHVQPEMDNDVTLEEAIDWIDTDEDENNLRAHAYEMARKYDPSFLAVRK